MLLIPVTNGYKLVSLKVTFLRPYIRIAVMSYFKLLHV